MSLWRDILRGYGGKRRGQKAVGGRAEVAGVGRRPRSLGHPRANPGFADLVRPWEPVFAPCARREGRKAGAKPGEGKAGRREAGRQAGRPAGRQAGRQAQGSACARRFATRVAVACVPGWRENLTGWCFEASRFGSTTAGDAVFEHPGNSEP